MKMLANLASAALLLSAASAAAQNAPTVASLIAAGHQIKGVIASGTSTVIYLQKDTEAHACVVFAAVSGASIADLSIKFDAIKNPCRSLKN